jgi:hypothetical protein
MYPEVPCPSRLLYSIYTGREAQCNTINQQPTIIRNLFFLHSIWLVSYSKFIPIACRERARKKKEEEERRMEREREKVCCQLLSCFPIYAICGHMDLGMCTNYRKNFLSTFCSVELILYMIYLFLVVSNILTFFRKEYESERNFLKPKGWRSKMKGSGWFYFLCFSFAFLVFCYA